MSRKVYGLEKQPKILSTSQIAGFSFQGNILSSWCIILILCSELDIYGSNILM